MLQHKTDKKLVQKALQGSESSWVKLVKRHESRLYNYCLRLTGSESDAPDLLQEIFLSVFRHLPSWNGTGEFSHWLMRIATNKIIDLHRQQLRLPWQLQDDESALAQSPAPSEYTPEREYETQQRNRLIMKAMSALPPEQRLLMELKFFQQMTFDEISVQTGVPVNTVKSRLYACLNQLKRLPETRHAL